MGKIITQCPSCKNDKVQVSKIECSDCHTTFEGKFELHPLLKLSDEDLEFVIDFVKCSGSLKEMAEQQHVSYPTLRNRLNNLIESLEMLSRENKTSKVDILQLVEDGKISAKDAAKMLQKL